MKNTYGLTPWKIVYFIGSKNRAAGFYAVTGIDKVKDLVGLYSLNDEDARADPFISIESIRPATMEERIEYLLAWFNINALAAVLTARINGVFPQFATALQQTGMTKMTLEDIPSLKHGLQIMDNPEVIHQFFNHFEPKGENNG